MLNYNTPPLLCHGQITLSDTDKICPLATPNQTKIHQHLLKLSSGNKNMGMSFSDNSFKIWWNFSISNPKPDLHNINAYTKFD